jgi:hypothetical protein
VEAATFVKERLLPNIIRNPAFTTNPRKVPALFRSTTTITTTKQEMKMNQKVDWGGGV